MKDIRKVVTNTASKMAKAETQVQVREGGWMPYSVENAGSESNVMYKEVTITNQQLLNDIGTGIDLLPYPGANSYYEIVKVIAEVGPNNQGYNSSGGYYLQIKFTDGNNQLDWYNITKSLLSDNAPVFAICGGYYNVYINGSNNTVYFEYNYLNSKLYIQTDDGQNFTDGVVPLKLKIWYITRQFTG